MVFQAKIGILIPQSKQYKYLDRDFVRGVKLNNLSAKYYVESIGLAADEQLIIDKIQKLLHQEEITLIIGFFGHHNMQRVYEYASDNNILLIASDLGATMPFAINKTKGVYINSYNLNESAYLLGHYFNKIGCKNIASSTSYYDAGYGMLTALEVAIQEKELSFSGHYVTPFYPREDESLQMQYNIETSNPDVVFAFHSGLYAKEHATFALESTLLEKFPYYTTAFCFDERLLENASNKDIHIIGSWIENTANTDSCHFSKTYQEVHRQSPSIFALLGYENGLILKSIMDNRIHSNTLLEEINKLQLEGPRGIIQFHPNTNRTFFNHYLFKASTNTNNTITFQKIETLKNDGSFIHKAIKNNPSSKSGGWQNAYLCH
jgi:branched-chain amino acid transport system substrate-binding protein